LAECHEVAKIMKSKKSTDSSGSDIFNGIKSKQSTFGKKKKKKIEGKSKN